MPTLHCKYHGNMNNAGSGHQQAQYWPYLKWVFSAPHVNVSNITVSNICITHSFHKNLCHYFNGLAQERHNSIANALELHLSCTNPSIWSQFSPNMLTMISSGSRTSIKQTNTFLRYSDMTTSTMNRYISIQRLLVALLGIIHWYPSCN